MKSTKTASKSVPGTEVSKIISYFQNIGSEPINLSFLDESTTFADNILSKDSSWREERKQNPKTVKLKDNKHHLRSTRRAVSYSSPPAMRLQRKSSDPGIKGSLYKNESKNATRERSASSPKNNRKERATNTPTEKSTKSTKPQHHSEKTEKSSSSSSNHKNDSKNQTLLNIPSTKNTSITSSPNSRFQTGFEKSSFVNESNSPISSPTPTSPAPNSLLDTPILKSYTVPATSPTNLRSDSSEEAVKKRSETFKKDGNRKSFFTIKPKFPKAQCAILQLEPVLEGHLMKRNHRGRWKKRWVIVDSERLYVFRNPEDFKEQKETVELLHSQVKLSDTKYSNLAFEVICSSGKTYFYAETQTELDHWMQTIQFICDTNMLNTLEESQVLTKEKKLLLEYYNLETNQICADCNAQKPEWASVNLGIFLCILCSGVHRALGTHISQVRSVLLDNWEMSQVEVIQKIGNKISNEKYEYCAPMNAKPTFDSALETRESWIKSKYETQDWIQNMDELQKINQTEQIILSEREWLKNTFLELLSTDSKFRHEVKMILKVKNH